MRAFRAALFVVAALAFTNCDAQSNIPKPTAEDLQFFEAKVRPLLVDHCFECHSKSSKQVQGNLRLDRYDAVLKGGDNGPAVSVDKPDNSRLLTAISYQDSNLQMPPAGRLTDSQIAVFRSWISRGLPFPNPSDESPAPGKRVIDIEAGKQHWAFTPLSNHQPKSPPLERHAHPIDRFITDKLAEQGLESAPPAARRALLVRASFDLLGLPPSLDDLVEFESDSAPDAYERRVDRLLASPHYGERWARFWLDLVRYSDVLESWAQSDAQAWIYRDWVIDALNDDLPYDQFVHLQLAADQFSDSPTKNRAALGFLGLSPSYWKELKLSPDVIKSVVAEEWEEKVTMVSGTLLGLTLGCARCHDHKYDPLTTQDYYGLAGVFASMRQSPITLLPKDRADELEALKSSVAKLEQEATKLTDAAKKDAANAESLKQKADQARQQADQLKAVPQFSAPRAYGVEDASLFVVPDGPNRTKLDYKLGVSQDVAVQLRGNPANAGPVVPRRFISVLSKNEPTQFTNGSGRRDLAEAIFRDASPLVARVIVNRIWRHHFGNGIVETPSNFGALGKKPSHPELLDHLASRLIQSGWSIKSLHRDILLTATYQQSSHPSPAALTTDPDNILLSHMPRRRLEIEAWRDRILSSTNSINTQFGGPARELSDPNNTRRTIYGVIKRRELNDLLRLYDFPDPTAHSPARLETTTPLQQLFALNSPFINQQADALARTVAASDSSTITDRIKLAYLLTTNEAPTDTQLQRATTFIGNAPSIERWKQFAEVLLVSNGSRFID